MYSIRDLYIKAKKEGRICKRCGWMITVVRWKQKKTLCGDCEDALQGVNVKYGHEQPAQETQDKTGESL